MPPSDVASFHGLIGRSAPMQALFSMITRVAAIDRPVLILGETGTGKELVAKAIQRLSRRRERQFEKVNCGTLTRELLLSELFGHERGAFTGAVTRKDGILAIADGGTVFLDEIGELPLDAQSMLLRFLQEGEIRPVGSARTRQVDVRVIAATHRNLASAIGCGTFRDDLYYRLCDMAFEVPPLRARREDIPLLIEQIRVDTNAGCDLAIEEFTREALALIERLPWRGNVRELETVIRRAMVLRGKGRVVPQDLHFGPVRFAKLGAANGRSVDPMEARPRPPLTWLQREARRLAEERQELRRVDFMARCGISRQVAGRELAGLVSAGVLRQVGAGRGARYVSAPPPGD
jgi:two-component system response regulator HydG